jgi:hypothetical protein
VDGALVHPGEVVDRRGRLADPDGEVVLLEVGDGIALRVRDVDVEIQNPHLHSLRERGRRRRGSRLLGRGEGGDAESR